MNNVNVYDNIDFTNSWKSLISYFNHFNTITGDLKIFSKPNVT